MQHKNNSLLQTTVVLTVYLIALNPILGHASPQDVTDMASSWQNSTSALSPLESVILTIVSWAIWITRIAVFPVGYWAIMDFKQDRHKEAYQKVFGILGALLWPLFYNWMISKTDTALQVNVLSGS